MKDFSKTNPASISEAVDILIASMSKKDREYIMNTDIDELVCTAHFGLGLKIRNAWLHHDDCNLTKNILEKGMFIIDPDDISGTILSSFFRKVKGLPEDDLWDCGGMRHEIIELETNE